MITTLLRAKFILSPGEYSGLPMWRIVWTNEQFEKRFGEWHDFSTEGLFIRSVTEQREAAKYTHCRDKYILERLVAVPEYQQIVGPIELYKKGYLDRCHASFYIGAIYNSTLPADFLSDFTTKLKKL